MEEQRIRQYLSYLHSEIAPALGCTEPAAVALAVAYASKEMSEEIENIDIQVSHYIYKNGKNVGIPGTDMIGLAMAAALGAVGKKAEKELLVLEGLSLSEKATAKKLVKQNKIKVSVASNVDDIYVQVIVKGNTETVRSVIQGNHKNLLLLEKNSQTIFEKTAKNKGNAESAKDKSCELTIDNIWDFANEVAIEELPFLREVIHINRQIAQEGLRGNYGLQVGKLMLEEKESPLVSSDISTFATAITAAAADARMSGCEKPVMSAAGSGNQGLTATLPVATIGWKLSLPEEKVLRALVISILITVHTKKHIGRLSVLCGCSVSAAIGTSAAIVYLLGGSLEQMKLSIKTMIADITGVICDGAKPSCALKIATATSSAIRSANTALNHMGASAYDGIINEDIEVTLANLGKIGNEGMAPANSIILDMI